MLYIWHHYNNYGPQIPNMKGLIITCLVICEMVPGVIQRSSELHEKQLDQQVSCETLQFSDVGSTGLISCVFVHDTSRIFWFKEINGSLSLLVSQENNIKNGAGYTSGDYDLSENGSLIIKNVSLHHDGNYTVMVFDMNDRRGEYIINFITFGSPEGQRPSIDMCGGQAFCIVEYNENQNISCSFQGVSPPPELKWFRLYSGRRQNAETQKTLLTGDPAAITTLFMSNLPRRMLLVLSCEATWPSLHSRGLSSTVVLDNSKEMLPLNKTDISTKILLEFVHDEFHCGVMQTSLISVWKMKKSDDQYHTIGYYYTHGGQTYTTSSVSYVGVKGSLTFQPVKRNNEGTYLCMTTDGFNDKYGFIRIKVQTNRKVSCETLQFSDVGSVGLILCVFAHDTSSIFWFKDMKGSLLSLVSHENNVKSGDGYTSGDYDLSENGSLIIKNVSLQHDGNYKVIVLDTNDGKSEYNINFITIGSPKGQHPTIDVCGGQVFCIAEYNENQNISCSFRGVSPSPKLKWYLVYSGRKQNVETQETLLTGDPAAITTVLMSNLPRRMLLVLSCEATWPSLHSRGLSSTVVLDNSKEMLPLNKIDMSTKILSEFAHDEFHCGVMQTSLISVWKMKKLDVLYHTIAYHYKHGGHTKTTSSVKYDGVKGSLILQPVKRNNEGIYLCMTTDGVNYKYALIRIKVQTNESVGCMSPQYSQTNSCGYIVCNFPSHFTVVYWHFQLNGTSKLLVSYRKNGYIASREYSFDTEYTVLETGSLVINKVEINDEGNYIARLLTLEDKVFTFDVNFITTVNPKQPFPTVNVCDGKEFCLIEYEKGKRLECRLDNVRPKADLMWYIKTSTREEECLNQQFPKLEYRESTTFSTSVVLPFSAVSNNVLQLLLCQTLWPSANSQPLISSVMIVNIDSLLPFNESSITPVDVLEKTRTKLKCKHKKRHFIFVWKVSPRDSHDFHNLAYTYRSENGGYMFSADSVSASLKYSSLQIESVDKSQKGVYLCIASDGKNHTVSMYNLTVISPPTPRYITVEQCDDENLCQIKSSKGVLSCQVSYVYPEVQLEIIAEDSNPVKLFNVKISLDKNYDTFNVSVRAEYDVVLTSGGQNISLFCRASGKATMAFKNQREIFLVLSGTIVKDDLPTDEPVTSNIKWIVIFAFTFIVVVIIFGIGLCIYSRKR